MIIFLILLYFQDWDRQSPTQVITEMCGFVTILGGTFLLHRTKDMADGIFSFIISMNGLSQPIFRVVFGIDCVVFNYA